MRGPNGDEMQELTGRTMAPCLSWATADVEHIAVNSAIVTPRNISSFPIAARVLPGLICLSPG